MTRKADSRPFSPKVVDRSDHCYRYSFRLFSFSPFRVGSRWSMIVGDRKSIHLWGLWVGKDREGERVVAQRGAVRHSAARRDPWTTFIDRGARTLPPAALRSSILPLPLLSLPSYSFSFSFSLFPFPIHNFLLLCLLRMFKHFFSFLNSSLYLSKKLSVLLVFYK